MGRAYRRKGSGNVNSARAICRGDNPLVFAKRFCKLPAMWKSVFVAGLWAGAAFGQTSPVEFANLREDVRGLTQRIGELTLKLEQLERENNELRQRASAADKSYVTVAQLRDAIEDVNRNLRASVESSKSETLHQVKTQIEKLGNATNAALESLAKSQAARPAAQPAFAEDYPKEGIRYTVQKGDTLAIIAKKTGAKQQDIINANKLSDPSRITVGQALFIPGAK
jgi:LysM repeat protein